MQKKYHEGTEQRVWNRYFVGLVTSAAAVVLLKCNVATFGERFYVFVA